MVAWLNVGGRMWVDVIVCLWLACGCIGQVVPDFRGQDVQADAAVSEDTQQIWVDRIKTFLGKNTTGKGLGR